jgi:hypothetical protein
VLRAFQLIFDFEENRIGFAEKNLNYGSKILTKDSPIDI